MATGVVMMMMVLRMSTQYKRKRDEYAVSGEKSLAILKTIWTIGIAARYSNFVHLCLNSHRLVISALPYFVTKQSLLKIEMNRHNQSLATVDGHMSKTIQSHTHMSIIFSESLISGVQTNSQLKTRRRQSMIDWHWCIDIDLWLMYIGGIDCFHNLRSKWSW